MKTQISIKHLMIFFALAALACNAPFAARGDVPANGATSDVTGTPVPPKDPTPVSPDDATCGLNAVTSMNGVDVSSWLIYCDTTYGFGFKYPGGGPPKSLTDATMRVMLPIQPGTTLVEKTVDVLPVEGSSQCSEVNAPGNVASEEVTVNGESFVKDSGGGVAAGNIYDWVAYSSGRKDRCVTLKFTLHDTNAGNYVTPPPQADLTFESVVFQTIMQTFRWTKP